MKSTYILIYSLIVLLSTFSIGQGLQSNSNQSGFCPLMEVNVAKTGQQVYTISYCNHGNMAAALSYVELTISNNTPIVYSSLPYRAKTTNVYRIDLGTVAPNTCNNFSIVLSTIFENNGCLDVKIYPDNPCQSMIDKFIQDNGGVIAPTGTTSGGTTTTVSSIGSQHASTENPLRLPPVNSVFEDNVMLNTAPIWDSLNNRNGGNGNMNIATNGNNSASGGHTSNGTIDIPGLSIADYCEITIPTSTTVNTTLGGSNAAVGLGSNLDDLTPTTTTTDGSSNVFIGSSISTTDEETFSSNENIEEAINILVYPNPFDNYANFEISGNVPAFTQLQLTDVTGRIVRTLSVTSQKNITLYKENLAAGVYFYRLEGDAAVLGTGKIIVR